MRHCGPVLRRCASGNEKYECQRYNDQLHVDLHYGQRGGNRELFFATRIESDLARLMRIDRFQKHSPMGMLLKARCAVPVKLLTADLRADNFAGDDDFNATVFLSSGSRVVICHGIGFAESLCRYRAISQSLTDQIIAYSIGALFR